MSQAPEIVWICPDDVGLEREWASDWRPHMGPWVEYVRADLAKQRVKPLVWRNSYGVLRAETPHGGYQIVGSGKILRMTCLPQSPDRVCENEEAAKAAAQAHHEAIIRGALENE